MSPGAARRCGPARRFRWHAAATASAHAPIHRDTLSALRGLITDGMGLRVGPDGVERAASGIDPGMLHCVTSGTTGPPKVIERSHASWIASFEENAALFAIGPGTGVAALGALTHSLALYAAVEAAHLGGAFHLLAGLGARAQIEGLARGRVRLLYATPAQLSLLAAAGGTLPDLRHVLCGGGALGSALRHRLSTLCPNARIAAFYGASETSFVTLAAQDAPPGSVGRPYGAAEVAIRKADSTGIGEVWVRSPYLFERYAAGGSAATRREGGWLTVGEMGWMDATGHLFITGRRDRTVRIAEQSVHPETIEALLLGDPDVTHASVLPRPDAQRGQTLVAVIEGAHDAALADRLARACRRAFGPMIAPRRFHFLPAFPLTPAGKPDLARLAAWLDRTP